MSRAMGEGRERDGGVMREGGGMEEKGGVGGCSPSYIFRRGLEWAEEK